ncbi:unnamed protein product, partial [Schistocephalus solidus]|uniref:Myotubularin phosphatase domain-containing protein n=1 Tax=Schistocephalus solidus TaxID=70667 RepID=A0A183TM37_SCHSO
SIALSVLGRARRQHQDWFDDNEAGLLAEKNRLDITYLECRTNAEKQPSSDATKLYSNGYVKCRTTGWPTQLSKPNGSHIKETAPLLSSDDQTNLTEKTQILYRWVEHFRNLLKRSSTISDAAVDRLSQVQTNSDLDLPSSLRETIWAV